MLLNIVFIDQLVYNMFPKNSTKNLINVRQAVYVCICSDLRSRNQQELGFFFFCLTEAMN